MPLIIFPSNTLAPAKKALRIFPITATFHPDTLSWRDRAVADGGLTADTDLIALNPFVEGIYNLGLRDRLNASNHVILELLPFMGSNLSSCLTKLWYPTSAPTVLNSSFVEADYSRITGLKGRSIAQAHLRSGFVPFNIVTGSISVGIYNRTDGGADSCEIGGDNSDPIDSASSRVVLHAHYLDNNAYFDAFDTTGGRVNTLTPINSSLGLIIGNRVSGGESKIYQNGNLIAASDAGGGLPPTSEISYFCLDYASQGSQLFSDRALGLIFIGKGIPETKISPFNTLVQNLMAALGRAV